MGGVASKIHRIGFEELLNEIKNSMIINTLPMNEQDLLISNTVPAKEEVSKVEEAIQLNKPIIIYGKNSRDDTVYSKYEQLIRMGYKKVSIYPGGLFEWMLLQDIYGYDKFPTTSKSLDILKYR